MLANTSLSTTLGCRVLACGVWGEGFEHWADLAQLLADSSAEPKTNKGPKPEIIPANERRRAPLPVRLAVESSWQATQAAQMDPQSLACVFVSGIGDTQLTDYMCKVLATDNKQLSPTKFHNSVHNAAAGYWTISSGCQQAANSVAGFQQSVSLTLLEAIIQCQQEQRPLLLTFFDSPVAKVLTDIMGEGSAFAASLIILPEEAASAKLGQRLSLEVVAGACTEPPLQAQHPSLQQLYGNNPAAKILPLLECLNLDANGLCTATATGDAVAQQSLSLPLSEGTSMVLTLAES